MWTKPLFRLAALLLAGTITAGCQASFGQTAFWARPAVSIPPRAVEIDEGADYVYFERYEPRGDSFFIIVRIRSVERGKTVNSGPFPDIRKKLKKSSRKAD
jgi:hypothetical protein